jgi:hypothetical protein
MKRRILVTVGGILLSAILLGVGGWLTLNFTSLGRLLPQFAELEKDSLPSASGLNGEDLFDALEQGLQIFRFVILPSIAILVGVFVGSLARQAAAQTAILSMLPLVVLFLTGSWGPAPAIWRSR